MSDESSQDRSMKELWQSQSTEGVRMSVEQIQAVAGKFQRRIHWRNVREYVTAMFLVVFFSYEFFRGNDPVVRAGFGLLIAGIFYLIWHLLSKGSWRPLPEDAGLSSCIEFQRRQLEQQRDLVSSVWRWYLAPLAPGMAILLVAFYRANPGHVKYPALIVLPEAIFFAVICVAVARLNENAARRLQRQIDELDEAGQEN
jgi:Flp pilus assembly protein TadB